MTINLSEMGTASVLRTFLLGGLTVCFTVVGACATPGTSSEGLEPAASIWAEMALDDYTFDFQRSCFCVRESVQPVTITVREGVVISVVSREAGVAVPVGGQIVWPTMGQILDEIEAARRDVVPVTVEYGTQGLPIKVEIGTLANDAGFAYLIGRVDPL